ncbi:MAG TPA: hypothetical protein VLD67_10200 [Vicinamibacterales bacterium]|nr:hypothetical protein [Vicinamibacterales bacterium]
MQRQKWQIAAAVIVAAALGATAGAQSPRPQEPDVLSALLTEVRGLRRAIEELALTGPRVQLALGRLQLQEQRVNTMIRRLESIRDAVASAQKENDASQAQLASLEAALKGEKEVPEEDRGMLPMMVKSFQKTVAAGAAEIQRLQAEEAFLQQQIATEQGRWSDINRTLEELERGLARR